MRGRVPSTTTCSGSGPAVLLLHAFPLGLAMWDAQARALRATHQVVRFDARGFGGIAARRRPAHHGAHRRRRGGAARPPRHRARPSCAACRWAATPPSRSCAAIPTRLRGLVLADTRGARGHGRGAARPAPTQADKVRREGAVGHRGRRSCRSWSGDTTQRERPAGGGPRARDDPGQRRRAASRTRWPAWPRARTRRRPCARSACRRWCVCGAEDALTPPADAEAIQRGHRGSRLEIVPAAGHLSNVEAPGAFGRALADFLASL